MTSLSALERSLFEVWAKTQSYDLARMPNDGEYYDQTTNDSWLAWQGRAAPTPPAVSSSKEQVYRRALEQIAEGKNPPNHSPALLLHMSTDDMRMMARVAISAADRLPAETKAPRGVKCTHCVGTGIQPQHYDEETGWSDDGIACATCDGSGQLTTVEQYLKTVPANWHEDSSVRTWFPILQEEIERLRRAESQSIAFKNGLRMDVVGWICSVCEAWCSEDDEFCAHPARSAVKSNSTPAAVAPAPYESASSTDSAAAGVDPTPEHLRKQGYRSGAVYDEPFHPLPTIEKAPQ